VSGTPHTKAQENRKRRNWLALTIVQIAIVAALLWWLWSAFD